MTLSAVMDSYTEYLQNTPALYSHYTARGAGLQQAWAKNHRRVYRGNSAWAAPFDFGL